MKLQLLREMYPEMAEVFKATLITITEGDEKAVAEANMARISAPRE
jgi:hypothetical protein